MLSAGFPRALLSWWTALTGRETRYVGRLYAERVFLFVVLTLAVVLSLDAARNLGRFLSDQPEGVSPTSLVPLLHYLALRAGYNLPSVLPIAAWVGVIWTEYTLAASRQRLMIANSGQPLWRSLMPALVVGLVLGLTQFAALAVVRPAAVTGQAEAGYRYYGPKFTDRAETGAEWLSVEGAVIRARVAFTDPPSLADAVIYDLDAGGSLQSIRTAARVTPVGDGRWTLEDSTVWTVPQFLSTPTGSAPPVGVARHDSETIALSLDPVWIENIDIQPPLLDQPTLVHLAEAGRGVQNASTYRAALEDRFAAILYLVGMTLLPAALGITLFGPKMGSGPSVNAVIWGVASYFGASVLSQLGAYGYLPAAVSAWTAPMLIVGSAVGVIAFRSRFRRASTG